MRIESLEPAGQGKIVRVAFDDGTALRLPAVVAAQFGLYPEMELTGDELGRIRAEAERVRTRESAVRIVSMTSVTEAGLRRKLVQKGRPAADADEAVAWMKQLKLLDDRQVASQIVRSCARKGYGPARVRQALYEKQVPKQYWDEALAELPDQSDAILDFLNRRFGGGKPDRRQIDRAAEALLRRGHGWDEIKRGLRRYEELSAQAPEDAYER